MCKTLRMSCWMKRTTYCVHFLDVTETRSANESENINTVPRSHKADRYLNTKDLI